MIYAVKNEGETNEKMLLRYKKLFFQSRIVSKLRKERYNVKAPTKKKIREAAIIRSAYREFNNKIYF
jgi:ribosomal protein S21